MCAINERVNDSYYLRMALTWASERKGFTWPNPAVGAVWVGDSGQSTYGFHHGAGHPHAEVEALKQVKDTGGTLYVTLEPCCHFGRTPPCTDLILQKNIKRVVYGFEDPNPKVAGRGAKILRSKGVEVSHCNLTEIDSFYREYSYWVRNGVPFTRFKIAVSFNGVYARSGRKRLILTRSDEAKSWVHAARKDSAAILTSSKTANFDNPKLNVRLGKRSFAKTIIVIDKYLDLDKNLRFLKLAEKVIVFCSTGVRPPLWMIRHSKILIVPMGLVKGQFVWRNVKSKIGEFGIHDLWCEAGATLLSSMVKQRALDELLVVQNSQWVDKGENLFQKLQHLDSAKPGLMQKFTEEETLKRWSWN